MDLSVRGTLKFLIPFINVISDLQGLPARRNLGPNHVEPTGEIFG